MARSFEQILQEKLEPGVDPQVKAFQEPPLRSRHSQVAMNSASTQFAEILSFAGERARAQLNRAQSALNEWADQAQKLRELSQEKQKEQSFQKEESKQEQVDGGQANSEQAALDERDCELLVAIKLFRREGSELSWPMSLNELKKQYRLLAKKTHPDLNSSASGQEEFLAINEAYETIKSHIDSAA